MRYRNWITAEISQVIDYQVDNRGRNPEEYLEKSIYPVVDNFMIKNQKYPNLNEANRYIDSNTFDNFLRGYVKKGDVLITLVGNGIGNLTTVPTDKCAIIQNTLGLICNTRMINDYLYYTLLSNKERIKKFDRGSSQPSIRKTDLLSMKIQIPPINEQKAIANILSSLDDKIEVNNKINKKLEELAQTLYKHWFVDFEFPNENGEPYKSSGGEMVDSELGLIPIGWKVDTIGNNHEILLGGTPARKNNDYWGKGYQWIKSGELNNLRIINGTEEITQLGLNNSSTKLMPIGTVLIGITGYVGIISMLEIEACANQSVIGILPNANFPRSYLYNMMKEESPFLSLKQTGSAQQHINKNDVDTHKIIIPTQYMIDRFVEIVEPLNKKISRNLFENDKLAETRDLLLPKLMSGEIRIPLKE